MANLTTSAAIDGLMGAATATAARTALGFTDLSIDLPSVASWVALFEASRLTPVADGTAVSTWADASGNSHDATQSGSNRPVYKIAANGINGRPVVRFTAASSQYMQTAAGGQAVKDDYYACALIKII